MFRTRGLNTVHDLFYFLPRKYEDRRSVTLAQNAVDGQAALFEVKVTGSKKIFLKTRGKSLFEVRSHDASGNVTLKWFHVWKNMETLFPVGRSMRVYGVAKKNLQGVEIIHPEIISEKAEERDSGRIVPIYTEIEGISTRVLRNVLWEALNRYVKELVDEIPEHYLKKHSLPCVRDAIKDVHFPTSEIATLNEFESPAQQRLIYDEFFKFEYIALKKKLKLHRESAPGFPKARLDSAISDISKKLPFDLTSDQKKAVTDILGELAEPHPMNRLLQGDVGSGKTIVALLAAASLISEGSQVALMSPTEILAEQHLKSAEKFLGNRVPVLFLTGSTPKKERAVIFERLQKGEPLLLIGTHALIEDPVQFKKLDLILIDEQHRFGVEQRRKLREKGRREEKGVLLHPHTLVLTATPIPRTLALTIYGDLSLSSIREKPPGRQEIKTHVVRSNWLGRCYQKIREELREGRQAYFIFPLVDESESEEFQHLKSAEEEYERIQKEIFPEHKVGLLHGRMKPDEKSAVMASFSKGETHILVSTTVVEVGVDVPNSTIMAVFNSERFGLSQLHQLRGRVGRGAHSSYCFLIPSERISTETLDRLQILERTNDGFVISEEDLKLRGPGEFLGTRQSGDLPFKAADLVRDAEWLLKARDDAMDLIQTDPDLTSENARAFRKYAGLLGELQMERLKTS